MFENNLDNSLKSTISYIISESKYKRMNKKQIYFAFYYLYLKLKQNNITENIFNNIIWDQYYPYPFSKQIEENIEQNDNLLCVKLGESEIYVLNIKVSYQIDNFTKSVIKEMSKMQILNSLSTAHKECIQLENLVYETEEE